MIKKYTPATESESELLNLLTEEMAECQQVISKIHRFGFDSYHPDDTTKTVNRTHLENELGDVLCILSILTNRDILSLETIESALIAKEERLKKFSNVYKEQTEPVNTLQEELDTANCFINDAFTAHPNLDEDVARIRKYG